MDQVTRPGRYSICNRERPDAAEALSRHGGPCAAGPDELTAALSHGRLEAGPGGGPAFRCLGVTPIKGRTRMGGPHRMRLREPDTWAAEMYGTRTRRGGRRAALSFACQARGVRCGHERSREAQEAPEEGRAE